MLSRVSLAFAHAATALLVRRTGHLLLFCILVCQHSERDREVTSQKCWPRVRK